MYIHCMHILCMRKRGEEKGELERETDGEGREGRMQRKERYPTHVQCLICVRDERDEDTENDVDEQGDECVQIHLQKWHRIYKL